MRRAGVVVSLALAACGEPTGTARSAAAPPRTPAAAAASRAPGAAPGDLEVLPLSSRPGVDDRDPLPPGVISRIGTLRFRADDEYGTLRFLGDAVMHESSSIGGFDGATGRRVFELDQSLVMAQSEDGRLAVALDFSDACTGVRLFEVPSDRTLACRPDRDGDEFNAGEWALSDRGLVVLEEKDDVLQVLDPQLQTVTFIQDAGAEEVERWAMSADGQVLAAIWRHPEYRYQLRLYQLPGGEPLPVPAAATGAERAVALSADGRVLAIGRDQDVRVIDRRSGRLLSTLPAVATRLKLSRDGALLVDLHAVGPRSTIIVWEASTGRRLWGHALGAFRVYADDYDFSDDGTRLAYMISNAIRVVDARTGRDPAGFGGPVGLRATALSPDGRRVATSSIGWVALWDADSGALLRSFRADEWFDGLQFARDGRSVYALLGTLELVQFPVATAGAPVRHRLPGCGGERSMQLPDGLTWILECDDGLAVWQAQPPRTLRRVKVPTRDAVHDIAMDPAGTRIAIASDDMAHGDVPSGSLRIDVIDTRTWKVQATSVEMSVQGVTMAVLPDGKILLDRTLLDPATGKTDELRAGLVATSTDRTIALMALMESPGGLFPWRVDRPLAIPADRTPRSAWDMYPRDLSMNGRLLECDRHSTCQVRILR